MQTAFVALVVSLCGVTSAQAAVSGIRVSGNQLVTSSGAPLHATGANRSGTEYACVQGGGQAPDASHAAAFWHRLPRVGLDYCKL